MISTLKFWQPQPIKIYFIIFLTFAIVEQNEESGRYFVATRNIRKVRSYYYNIKIDIDYFNDIYYFCRGK